MTNKLTFPKPIPTAISVGLTLLIWFVIPVPDKVTPEAWHLLALFTGTIAAIIGKALPTIFHWSAAAWPGFTSVAVLPGSNFGERGLRPVGSGPPGMQPRALRPPHRPEF